MFGLSFGEILIILVVALLVLGPTGMPKLARTLGKGLRDFRRATGDIRGAFEQEFYKLDQEVENVARAGERTAAPAPAAVNPAAGLETAHIAPKFEPPEGVAAQGPAPVARPPAEGTVARTEAEPASAEAEPIARKAATGSDETR